MTLDIRPFDVADTEPVVALWHAAGLTRPWNDPHRDIERKLAVQPELFLVAVDGDVVVGTVMAGYDGHRGWLYYLASAPDRRNEGIATEAMHAAIDDLWGRTDAESITAYIEHGEEKEPSRRLAAKLGFAVRGPGRGRSGEPMTVYELLQDVRRGRRR